MNINIVWLSPLDLVDGSDNLTFGIGDQSIPDAAGCYVFFNQYGNSQRVIYIGKANSLSKRINHQFKTNVRLMNVIKNFPLRGYKKVMCCTISPRPGQRIQKILTIVEKNLIKHALTNGHELINIQGSRINFHEIKTLRGNRIAGSLFGRKILSQSK
jgi:hypothetical protein